jgi:peroxiredoxin
MRSAAVPHLGNGETFPSLQLPLVGGETLSLPDDLAGDFGVVLVYRGAWRPYCNA